MYVVSKYPPHCPTTIATLDVKIPPLPKQTITFRQYQKIDAKQFQCDLETSDLIGKPSDKLDELIDQYYNTLSCLLDKYAPVMTKTLTDDPVAP